MDFIDACVACAVFDLANQYIEEEAEEERLKWEDEEAENNW